MKHRLLIFFLIYLTANSFAQNFSIEEQHQLDSLNEVINNPTAHDTATASAYVGLSEILYISNIDTVIWLCYKTKIIAETGLKKTTTSQEINSFKKSLANALNNIGYVHSSQGDINKALKFYHHALKIREEIYNKKGVANSLNNIGAIYKSQGDIHKALDYYHQSLKIRKEINHKEGIASSLNNIGGIYYSQGELTKALDYNYQSLKIKEEINNKKGVANSLNNIGAIYKNQGDTPKALDYYNQSLKIREEIGDKEGIASSLNVIGAVELLQGNQKVAKTNFTQALRLAKELGYPNIISKAAIGLNEIALKENNYKTAYNMYKLHIVMRDSTNSEEHYKASIQQQAKYEYEKQKALDDLEAEKLIAIEKEKQAKEKEKQQVITYAAFGGIVLIGGFLAFVFNRLRITKKQKLIIEKQKQQVEIAHHKTEQQKEIIVETHKEMTDSINYAKRLQDAILPSFSDIKQHLPNNFVFFQPKDVVSGDFYWFARKNNISFLASADCTGHGVPGAMVSVVCSNALHRTVNEFGITEPSKILDKTRELVIETFAKSGEEVKDGMDIALCAFSEQKVVFSGANNPLWIVRQIEKLTPEYLANRSTLIIENLALIEFKADKQPIGLYVGMKPFTQTEINVLQGDTLYFFTDGFADQFGGEKGKKFKYKSFKRILIEISTKPMAAQKEIIQSTFNNWKGDLEQIDDVCVIGVKIG